MTVRQRLVAGVLVVLLAGCGAGSNTSDGGTPSGSGPDSVTVTESGFRPRTNGFSFPNRVPVEAFDYADAIAMFGPDAVCREPDGGCTPRPEAAAWVEKVAAASWGGLCEGMAVMATDRWVDHEQPDTAGLPETTALAHRLQQWWATQFLDSVMQAGTERTSDPGELLDRLEQAIRDDGTGATLTLDHRGASHTLVPFAVRRSADSAEIGVYDPNSPGEERSIRVDLAAGRWTYDFPSDPPDKEPWTGTIFDISVISLTARSTPWAAPFLRSPTAATVATVTTSGTWTIVRASADGSEAAIRSDDVTVGTNGVMALVHGGALGVVTVVVDPAAGLRVETGSPAHLTLDTPTGTVSATTGPVEELGAGTPAVLTLDTTDGPSVDTVEGTADLSAFTPSGTVRAAAGGASALRIGTDGTAHATIDGADEALVTTDPALTDAIVDPSGAVRWSEPARLPAEVRDGTPEPPTSPGDPGDGTTTSTTPGPGSSTPSTIGPTDGSDRVTISIEFVAPGSVHVAIASLPTNTIPFVPSLSGPGVDLQGASTLSIDRTATDLQSGAEYTITLAFEDGFVVNRSFVLP